MQATEHQRAVMIRNMLTTLLGTPSGADPKLVCALCQKSERANATPEQKLKKCSRCHDSLYCSRECQVVHWKTGHKSQCSKYLASLPSEEEAMDRLIDAYRLSVEDDYAIGGETRGLYNMENPIRDFKRFLDRAEKRPGILPRWWDKEKRKICERRALDQDSWSCITYAVEKSDIQEHYGDLMMPMMLRMLAELVYEKPVGNRDTASDESDDDDFFDDMDSDEAFDDTGSGEGSGDGPVEDTDFEGNNDDEPCEDGSASGSESDEEK